MLNTFWLCLFLFLSFLQEGMAYTSDPVWFRGPWILVAGDLRTMIPKDRLEMSGLAYPMPVKANITGKELAQQVPLPRRRVNSKFFIKNVIDTKISAMQFFGGNLYTLYNNDRIIRAYEPSGALINEWALPVGEPFYVSRIFCSFRF